MDKLFDRYYYESSCGPVYERSPHWLNFFGNIADHIVRKIGPATVLDAGCAMGFLVESLRDRGVQAYGIDISDYAIENVRADMKPYCRVGSILEPFPQKYDLIVSIEVLEHLHKDDGEKAIENLCRASDQLLFSSTPIDYREATHFNVQPIEYWTELFAAQQLVRDVDFDASFITSWAILFHRNYDGLSRVIRNYERRFWQLWKENCDLRDLAVETRNRLAEMDRQVLDKEQQRQQEVQLLITQLADLTAKFQQEIQMLQGQLVAQERLRQAEVQAVHEQLVGKDIQIQDALNEIRAIKNSETWRVLQFFGRARRLFKS